MEEHDLEPAIDQAAPSPEVVKVLVDNHRQFLAFLEKRLLGPACLLACSARADADRSRPLHPADP